VKRLPTITALVALVLLAACTAAPPKPPASTGIVTGRLLLEGGASQDSSLRPISGTVQFTGHHQLVKARAGSFGTFSVRLSAGTYRVSASSPHISEQLGNGTTLHHPPFGQQPVTVTARHTTRITLTFIAG
jgi:hypothetical protein